MKLPSILHPTTAALLALGLASSPQLLSAESVDVAAFPSTDIWVAPNGVDDTAALQAALDRCSRRKAACTIHLTRGEFHTAPLVATGFHGAIQGAGMRLTAVRTLTDRALHLSKARPFSARDPTPAEPWPSIITFIEGDIRLSDLTLSAPLGTKTDGWYPVCLGTDPPLVPTLQGAITMSGRKPMNVRVHRVAFEGAADPADAFVGFTLIQSEVFAGFLLPRDFQDPCLDVIRLQGTITEDATSHSQVAYGPFLVLTDQLSASFTNSRYDVLVDAIQLYELHRSRVFVANNTTHSVLGSGIATLQNVTPTSIPSDRSEFTFLHNRIDVTTASVAGISYLDYANGTSPRSLNIVDNDIAMAGGSSYGIGVSGTRNSAVLARNAISGAPDLGIGIAMERTSGCRVLQNDFRGLDSGTPDILLAPSTSRCLVVATVEDTVIDQGSDNRLIRR